jgi:hypothetical protein
MAAATLYAGMALYVTAIWAGFAAMLLMKRRDA